MPPEILDLLRRQSGLGLDREGRWMIRGEAVSHARIIDTLNRGLDLNEDGEVVVRVGNQWAYVEADDTAFVVRNLRPVGKDRDHPEGLELILNNEGEELLDPSTLFMPEDGALYCSIMDGRTIARFLRPAYHNLLPYLVESSTAETRVAIRMGKKVFGVGKSQRSSS